MTDILARLRAALAGRYTLERELGRGGMATVWLARDVKHGRPVALKVLRPELAAALGPERFVREITLTAGLDHPHILPLLDSGDAGGFLFYTMPYVEGESLRDRLNRENQLPLDDALQIAREVADALGYAHSRGIIHRDIKPENILLAGGHARVVDFGIARAVAAAGSDSLTETGIAVGTPIYMSPEQASASQALDGRSDLYSLATVLYEMLAGDPPFAGTRTEALLARKAVDPVPRLRTVRDAVSPALEAVVLRALARAPADRYRLAAQFAAALEEPVTVPPAERSIVVLPFSNLSADPDDVVFADGLTDELITDLSKIRALRVISRTSAMRYRATTKPLPVIASEAGVRYVLEGSVRRIGDGLRITAQLIEAATEKHVWSEKYSGTIADVFDIQEKVSRAIVDALRVKLTAAEYDRLADRWIGNVQAYECYHRGWNEAMSGTREGLALALDRIQEAIDLVGDNEVLYSAMGQIHLEAVNLLSEPDSTHLVKVEEAIDKIGGINPDSPHLHRLIGGLRYKSGDVQQAARHLQRAFAIDSTDPATAFYLAGICAFSGRVTEARPYAQRLFELDPLTPMHQWWWAWVEVLGGTFDVALDPMRRTHRLHPEDALTAYFYAIVLQLNERREDASAVIDQLVSRFPDQVLARQMVVFKAALMGDATGALGSITPELEAAVRLDEHCSWLMARCYALLNRRTETLSWLEHAALDRGFINYPMLATYDRAFDQLRGDAGFETIMQRVKRRWEMFEV